VRTRRTLLVPALALALVTGGSTVATAGASTTSDGYTPFRDAPFGVHEPGIDWLAGSGVTAGCTTSTYCPGDPVTRAQMATFLHRLSGNADGTAPSVDAATVGGRTAGQLAVINGFVEVTERQRRVDAVVDVEAPCPDGTRVLGGGGTIDGLYAQVSASPTAGGRGWAVVWVSTDHRTHEVDATVTATCAPVAAGARTTGHAAPTDAERRQAVDRLRDQAAVRR
jgi:hypothetical protein